MNNTNRALNRILLFLIGLVLLILGAAAVLIIAWPTAADLWMQGSRAAQAWLQDAVETTSIEGSAASWIVLGILAVIILIVVLLIVPLTRLGGRRSHAVVRSTGQQNPIGRVTVTEAFVSDALQNAFENRHEILFARVSANEVRSQPVLHVSVSPRQNTSPRAVVDDVSGLVSSLATLTGRDIATYISIHAGLRTALAQDQRRLR